MLEPYPNQFKKWNPEKGAIFFVFSTEEALYKFEVECRKINELLSKMVHAKIQ